MPSNLKGNFENLKRHILSLSHNDNFYHAKNEWTLDHIQVNDELDRCPCGQPIKDLCYIHNQITNHTTYVGNICINRFLLPQS